MLGGVPECQKARPCLMGKIPVSDQLHSVVNYSAAGFKKLQC